MVDLRRLKYELFERGIIPTDQALDKLPKYRLGRITVSDFPTTGGLILQLSDEIFVNAPLGYKRENAFALDLRDQHYVLLVASGEVPIQVHSPADYALENKRLSSGKSVRAVANTHADRVRLNPIHGCDMTCHFCNYPNMAYRKNTVEELAEGLDLALAEERIMPPPHVLVSGGTPYEEREDFDHFDRVCEELPSRYPDLRWDLMLSPRGMRPEMHNEESYRTYLKQLKSWRFDAVSVNLELFSDDAQRRYVPEKHEIGTKNYLSFLKLAVEIFGPGKVRSDLVVGLEPEAKTLQAVAMLAEQNVLVELCPFVAAPGAMLSHHPEPTADDLERISNRAYEIAEAKGRPMTPFCIPCSHNIL